MARKPNTQQQEAHLGFCSFFTGAGFLDAGFVDEGFECHFANEYSPSFAKGFEFSQSRLGHKPPTHGLHVGSIEDLLSDPATLHGVLKAARKAGQSIGFIGGPPCPDFSVGGKNRGATGDNGRLTRVYFDLICRVSPDWFVFENVKGLFRTHRHREFFEEMRDQVRRAGYQTSERLINSIEYGVAQDRERIIMLGTKSSPLNVDWVRFTKYPRSVLTETDWPHSAPFGRPARCPKGVPADLTVSYWFERNEVDRHPNSTHGFKPRAGLKRFQSVAEGDDSRKSFKRLHRFRYSPTACYGNNEVHLHPTKARRITVAEALAIQSLPAEYALPPDMTLSDMFKTVGNGVPYLAARGIARTVNAALQGDR